MESGRSGTNVRVKYALPPQKAVSDNDAKKEISIIVLSDSTAPPHFSGLNGGLHLASDSIHSPSVTSKIAEKQVASVSSKIRQKPEKSDWGSSLKVKKKIVKSWESLEKERSDREFSELNQRSSGGCNHTRKKRQEYGPNAEVDSDGFSISACQEDCGSASDYEIERLFDYTSESEL